MTNDIGTTKLVLPPVAQASPTATVGRPKMDVHENGNVAPTQQAEEPEKAEKAEEEQQEPLKDVVSHLNDLVRELHRELEFSVDQDSGDTVIKVIDRETDEVVRQIPSEELVHLRKRLQEAAGVIFRDSA